MSTLPMITIVAKARRKGITFGFDRNGNYVRNKITTIKLDTDLITKTKEE